MFQKQALFLGLFTLLFGFGVYGAPPAEPKCEVGLQQTYCTFRPANANAEVLFRSLWNFVDRRNQGFEFHPDSKFNADNTDIDLRDGTIHFYTNYEGCDSASCLDLMKDFLIKNDVGEEPSNRDLYNLVFTIFEINEQKAEERGIGWITDPSAPGFDAVGQELPSLGDTISGSDVNGLISVVAGSIGVNDLLLNLTLGSWNQSVTYSTRYEAVVEQGIQTVQNFVEEEAYLVTDGVLDDDTKVTISDFFGGTLLYGDNGEVEIKDFSFQVFIKNQDSKSPMERSRGWNFSEERFRTVTVEGIGQRYRSTRARLRLQPGVPAHVLTVENVARGQDVGKGLTGYSRSKGKTGLHLMVTVAAYPQPGAGKPQSHNQLAFGPDGGRPSPDNFSGAGSQAQTGKSALVGENVVRFSPYLKVTPGGGVEQQDYMIKLDPSALSAENWNQKINITVWSEDGLVQPFRDTSSMLQLAERGYQFGVPLNGAPKDSRIRFKVQLEVDPEFLAITGGPGDEPATATYGVLHHIKAMEGNSREDVRLFESWLLDPK